MSTKWLSALFESEAPIFNTLTGYVKANGSSAATASATIPNTDITGLGTASTHADADYVHIAGAETITGVKTFSGTLAVQGSSTNSIYLTLNNTLAGAHSYALYSAGSAGPSALGSFGLYDNTAGAVRFFFDSSGAATFSSTVTGTAFNCTDRTTTTTQWQWYADGGASSTSRLYNSINGDVVTCDLKGNLRANSVGYKTYYNAGATVSLDANNGGMQYCSISAASNTLTLANSVAGQLYYFVVKGTQASGTAGFSLSGDLTNVTSIGLNPGQTVGFSVICLVGGATPKFMPFGAVQFMNGTGYTYP